MILKYKIAGIKTLKKVEGEYLNILEYDCAVRLITEDSDWGASVGDWHVDELSTGFRVTSAPSKEGAIKDMIIKKYEKVGLLYFDCALVNSRINYLHHHRRKYRSCQVAL